MDFRQYHIDLRRMSVVTQCFGIHWFNGKRILEFSTEFTDLDAMLRAVGADITLAKGRTDALKAVRENLRLRSSSNDLPLDADGGIDRSDAEEAFDLILYLDFLNNLDDWRQSLREAIDVAPFMILESEISDGEDPAFQRSGSRHSAELVERALESAGWNYERLPDSDSLGSLQTSDWTAPPGGSPRLGPRGVWVCGRN